MSLARDQRGVAYVETLIAFPALLFTFLGLYMFSYICVAHLVVQRAASGAARGAAVILPDDPVYYEAPKASKDDCVRQAAVRVLFASPHLHNDTLQSKDPALVVSWNAGQKIYEPLTVRVETDFDCGRFLAGFMCGPSKRVRIGASSTFPYQKGPVGDE